MWTDGITKRALKQIDRLPGRVRETLAVLIREIEADGPFRGNWPNFSALTSGRYHCHLRKGRPTYVAIWEVRDISIRFIEVSYAGTHEKAPY